MFHDKTIESPEKSMKTFYLYSLFFFMIDSMESVSLTFNIMLIKKKEMS